MAGAHVRRRPPARHVPVIDLRPHLRAGDTILVGHGTAEPRALLEALIAQRHELPPVNLFVGASYTGTLQPEHLDVLRVSSFGAIGRTAALIGAGRRRPADPPRHHPRADPLRPAARRRRVLPGRSRRRRRHPLARPAVRLPAGGDRGGPLRDRRGQPASAEDVGRHRRPLVPPGGDGARRPPAHRRRSSRAAAGGRGDRRPRRRRDPRRGDDPDRRRRYAGSRARPPVRSPRPRHPLGPDERRARRPHRGRRGDQRPQGDRRRRLRGRVAARQRPAVCLGARQPAAW